MKNILLLLVLVGAIGALYVVINNRDKGEEMSEHMDDTVVEKSDGAMAEEEGNRMVVDSGTYTVNAEQSEFTWAGKKPLIDGYINSGTIAMSEGTITVGESEASGNFVLDMNTLNVGLTAKKPGQEGTLEGHLKGERWFDVATYPTATFVITDVSPTAQTESEFVYTVTGDLTLKGVTNTISFPAQIYETTDGVVHAEAETEIDRTAWGLTSGSGNFFENLGDNMIDDMVAISFSIVATSN